MNFSLLRIVSLEYCTESPPHKIFYIFIKFCYNLCLPKKIRSETLPYIAVSKTFQIRFQNWQKLFAAASTCSQRKYAKTQLFMQTKLIKQKQKILHIFLYSETRDIHVPHIKFSIVSLFLVSFSATKPMHIILCARAVLSALVGHLS
jgi:hypothetical protein